MDNAPSRLDKVITLTLSLIGAVAVVLCGVLRTSLHQRRIKWQLDVESVLLGLCLVTFVGYALLNATDVALHWQHGDTGLTGRSDLRVRLGSQIVSVLCLTSAQLSVLDYARVHGKHSDRHAKIDLLFSRGIAALVVALSALSMMSYGSSHDYSAISSIASISGSHTARHLRLCSAGLCALLTCSFYLVLIVIRPLRELEPRGLFDRLLLATLLFLAYLSGIMSNTLSRHGTQDAFAILQVHLTLIAALLAPLTLQSSTTDGVRTSAESPLSWQAERSSACDPPQQAVHYRGVLIGRPQPIVALDATAAQAFRLHDLPILPGDRDTAPGRDSLGTNIHARERERDTIRNLSQLHQAGRRGSTGAARVRSTESLPLASPTLPTLRVTAPTPSTMHDVFLKEVHTRPMTTAMARNHASRPDQRRRHTVHYLDHRVRPTADLHAWRRLSYQTPPSLPPFQFQAGSGSGSGSSSHASSARPLTSTQTPDSDLSLETLIRQNFKLASLHHKGKRASSWYAERERVAAAVAAKTTMTADSQTAGDLIGTLNKDTVVAPVAGDNAGSNTTSVPEHALDATHTEGRTVNSSSGKHLAAATEAAAEQPWRPLQPHAYETGQVVQGDAGDALKVDTLAAVRMSWASEAGEAFAVTSR